MAKNVAKTVVWMFAGMIIMGGLVWFTMPSLMLVKHKSIYGYEQTITVLTEALKSKADWRVLTVNDYQKSTAAFTELERVGSVTICNPRYASLILADDQNRKVTAFMPLGIGVYEDKSGQVFVSRLNVGLMGMMFGGTISEVMSLAGTDLAEVVSSVTSREQ